MLELIVLGQIPGTNVYLSFSALAAGLLISIILAVAGLSYLKKHYENNKKEPKEKEAHRLKDGLNFRHNAFGIKFQFFKQVSLIFFANRTRQFVKPPAESGKAAIAFPGHQRFGPVFFPRLPFFIA